MRDAIAVPESPFDARELVGLLADEGILDRDHGVYWRTGGTFDPT